MSRRSRAAIKAFPLAIAMLGLFLAGCASQAPQVHPTDDETHAIAPGDAPLSIDGGGALEARYDQRRFATHTTTNVEFRNGSIIFEVSGTNAMFGRTNDLATRQIDRVIAPHLVALGFAPDRSTLRRGRTHLGDYAMIAATGLGRTCWMFEQYPEVYLQFYDNGGFYKAYLAGFICSPQGGPAADAETATKRLLDALYLDNGALNRAQVGR